MSSANLMMWLALYFGTQSWISSDGLGVDAADSHVLWPPCKKVQHPVAERSLESQVSEFLYELLGDDCVECRTEVQENSIRTYKSFESRWVRAGWRAAETASSVELFDLYTN